MSTAMPATSIENHRSPPRTVERLNVLHKGSLPLLLRVHPEINTDSRQGKQVAAGFCVRLPARLERCSRAPPPDTTWGRRFRSYGDIPGQAAPGSDLRLLQSTGKARRAPRLPAQRGEAEGRLCEWRARMSRYKEKRIEGSELGRVSRRCVARQ